MRLSRELRREIHSLGVTGGQVSLLYLIQRDPGIGVRELAARERMSPAGMSKYVARLEQAGLVHRTELADRRRVGLELTAEGARRRTCQASANRLARGAPASLPPASSRRSTPPVAPL